MPAARKARAACSAAACTQDRDWDPDDRSVDLRVGRIRRKIETDPKKPEILKTVHGLGYVFSTGKS